MKILITAFPRSANTFLRDLLVKAGKDMVYKKIPRDFRDFSELEGFMRETSSEDGKTYILGHNHFHDNIEYRISGAKDIIFIFSFRNPMKNIASFFALLESKSYHEGRNFFNTKEVLSAIKTYNKIFLFYLYTRILGKKVIALEFKEIIKSPEKVIEKLNSRFGLDLNFEKDAEEEYLKSDFHNPKRTREKDEKKGYMQHLSFTHKILIWIFCMPVYLLSKI